MGEAGTRIPEAPFTSVYFDTGTVVEQVYNCGTYCPGYLPSGSHPQTPGELVVNVTVCYNCDGDICNYSNNVVKIRHCGEYFVYYLTRPKSCLKVNTIDTHPPCFTTVNRYCTE